MQFGFEQESRKSIRVTVKREVYKRAGKCCECCGMGLKVSEGDFHHYRSPTISPTAKTVQFLCPTCHRKYGHTRKVVTHHSILGDEKGVALIIDDTSESVHIIKIRPRLSWHGGAESLVIEPQ